jgi:hypothetical protein
MRNEGRMTETGRNDLEPSQHASRDAIPLASYYEHERHRHVAVFLAFCMVFRRCCWPTGSKHSEADLASVKAHGSGSARVLEGRRMRCCHSGSSDTRPKSAAHRSKRLSGPRPTQGQKKATPELRRFPIVSPGSKTGGWSERSRSHHGVAAHRMGASLRVPSIPRQPHA